MTFLAERQRRRVRAAMIRELRAWNDLALKDIGLTRGEIIAAVDGRLERGGRRQVAPAPMHSAEGAVGSPEGDSNRKKPDAAARSPALGPAPLRADRRARSASRGDVPR